MGMSISGAHEYAESIKPRYFRASRAEKATILTEFCAATGYSRKSALRLFHRRARELAGLRKPAAGRRGRKSPYRSDEAFMTALRQIWRETEYMCGKNLCGAMDDWLLGVQRRYGRFNEQVIEKLLRISGASIDRVLRPYRVKRKRGGTKPGTLLRAQIPIQKIDSLRPEEPGHLEADTVAHCGGSLSGMFVWSVTATDIFTQWTEVRAMWHKGARGALAAIKDIEESLPFRLLGFDCDNGGEFLNKWFIAYFHGHDWKIYFTRSREYQSNDNAHVEGKNWTHVRQLLGYRRIENRFIMDELNEALRDWSLLRNHFFPVRRLVSKAVVGSRSTKIYDKPKAPYQRVLDCPNVSSEVKEQLKRFHESTDPVALRRSVRYRVYQLLKQSSVTAISEASIT